MTASAAPVTVRRRFVILPTYVPDRPDRYPMFLEKRVYQGSSGRVYPLPVVDRIAERPTPQRWRAIFLENEFVRVMLLPELGGRIHRLEDKTNGYDAIYYQPVIKPALVGLTGPWCSGGIEFNWPQHHRPSTFMPTEVAIERRPDGAVTVWMSEHDPMARMKGMHGVRLHPGRSTVELAARVYNRTPHPQTFLWWANVATRVHGDYQSFFPPDTTHVADHAKRATSTFPRATGRYYGVDYARRAQAGVPPADRPRQFPPRAGVPPDDLSWYANIPVPTSYMCMGSREDFVGGYDFAAQAGLMHVANHHIAPGKKQWTWGNHEFGYAWDRNLTDADATGEFPPYIELMAGVYTDNQPDFSFLQPGETRTWSQFWYPFRGIGPAQRANPEAALSLQRHGAIVRIGVAVTRAHARATVRLDHAGRTLRQWRRRITPGEPVLVPCPVARGTRTESLRVSVSSGAGVELLSYQPAAKRPASPPPPASEPAAPADIASADQLFLTGLHLEQYRHATRPPADYWREALRRDPDDARCNLALGRWHARRGEWSQAESHLRRSIARQTERNPNPADGEAHYQLGLCLRARADDAPATGVALHAEAYAAFYKATWNQGWAAAGFHALAEIDCAREQWELAAGHLERALRLDADNLRARNLQAIVLRRLGRPREATRVLRATLALDPLDAWARHLSGHPLRCDLQVRLDVAHDCIRAGLWTEARDVLGRDPGPANPGRPDGSLGAAPLFHYLLARIHRQLGDARTEERHLAAAARVDADYCFPARSEEIALLEYAARSRPRDARAPLLLGHLLYDRRRHEDAIRCWERSARLDPANPIVWRNLGIAYHNIRRDPPRARRAYERAFRLAPRDARLLYERDQLWKRLGVTPTRRLQQLQRHPRLVAARDDLTVELGELLLTTGRPEAAQALVAARRFQPWEGGEGQALGLHVRSHLALGRRALARRDPATALAHFEAALGAPENLGEAKHLLANQSDIHFWLGCANAAAARPVLARRQWRKAAAFRGDFQAMSVRSFSEMTYFSARALQQLGRTDAARRLLLELRRHARRRAKQPAAVDYFATSLPTMLLFDDDLAARQHTAALFLEAQAELGLGRRARGRRLLRQVLRRDPNHSLARDFLGGSPANER